MNVLAVLSATATVVVGLPATIAVIASVVQAAFPSLSGLAAWLPVVSLFGGALGIFLISSGTNTVDPTAAPLPLIAQFTTGVLSVGAALIAALAAISRRKADVGVIALITMTAVGIAALSSDAPRVGAAGLHIAVLAVAILMAIEGGDWKSATSATVYVTLSSIGLITLVAGIAFAEVQRVSPGGLVTESFVIAILTVGFALSIGVVPIYFWVPTVAQRPGIGSTMLAIAVVSPATISLLVQVLGALPQLGSAQATSRLLSIGGVSTCIAGTIGVITAGRLRRRVGYALLGHTGVVLLGLGTATRIGVAGALMTLAQHVFVAIVLLASAMAIETESAGSRVHAGGRPVRAAFVLGALVISGIPPLGGFASRWLVMQALSLTDWRLVMLVGTTSLLSMYGLLAGISGSHRRSSDTDGRRTWGWLLLAVALFISLWTIAPAPLIGAAYRATSQLSYLRPF